MKSKWLYLSFVLAFMAACGDEVTDDTDDTDGTPATFVDADGDKFQADVDCNDADAAINPIAAETYYDGKDNDCDAATIDDDQDGDGAAKAEDCDDTDAGVNPDAAEIADGIDNNCDGETMIASEEDNDGDGFSAAAGDCNDRDKTMNPDAAEVYYDGIDNDCDTGTKDKDQDDDGVKVGADCDDLDADRSPDNAEVYYDGMDNDCDMTTIDDDKDGDGFAATSEGGDDCADGNADRNPGMADIPADGVDNDCSGADLTVNTTNGIFVDGTNGDDMNAGTKALPKKTIQAAADAIYGDAKTVFVAKGIYVESVTTSVSIIGGFRNQAGTWTYAPGSNPVAITSDSNGTAGIEVLGDFTVSLVSLDVSGFNNSASGQYGVYVNNEANLLVYASTITSGLSGDDAYGISGGYWMSQIISVVDSTVEAVNTVGDSVYPIDVEYADKFVLRDSHIHTTSNYCRLIELYATDSHIVDNTLKCDDLDHSVTNGGLVIYTEMGKHLIADNTFANQDITVNTDLIEIDSGEAVVRDNTFNIGELRGSVDLIYPYYANLVAEGNTFNIQTLNADYVEMYGEESNARYANNTLTALGNLSTGTDLYPLYVEYGNYESYGNTWTVTAYPVRAGYLESYFGYATLISRGDSVKIKGIGISRADVIYNEYSDVILSDYSSTIVGGASGDVNVIYMGDEQQAVIDGMTASIGYVGGEFDAMYIEEGYYRFNDLQLSAGDVSDGAYGMYLEYPGLVITNSDITIGNVEGWFYGAYVDYGTADLTNVNVTVGDCVSCTDDSYGLYVYYATTTWRGGDIVIGDSDNGYALYGSYLYYGPTQLHDVNVRTGESDDENYGMYAYANGVKMYNTTLRTGGSQADNYGIYTDDYVALQMDSSRVLVGPSASDSYGYYNNYAPSVIVDSVIAVTGATTDSDSYGIYDSGGYADYQIINSYVAAGEGVEGSETVAMYMNGYANYVAVNSIFSAGATSATNVGGEAVILSSGGDDNTMTLINNVFTSSSGIDTIGWMDGGDLDTMGDVNGCEWVECQQASGNFKVNDVDNLFVNRAANNYKQKASSAGVDAGVDGTPYTYYPELLLTDMNGTTRPAGGTWDIGPDELP